MTKKDSINLFQKKGHPLAKIFDGKIQELSNEELLSIFIGPGTFRWNSVEIAKKVLTHFNWSFSDLAKSSAREMMSIHGIGPAKTAILAAAFELGRRRQAHQALAKKRFLTTRDAAQYITPLLQDYEHEVFGILFLNGACKMINFQILFHGGLSGVVADIRIIMQKALFFRAARIIICHNHPSGNCRPSRADEEVTQQILSAATLFDIILMDHIIVTEDGYYSFADNGKIDQQFLFQN